MMAETLIGPIACTIACSHSSLPEQSSGFFTDTTGAVASGGAWREGVREGGERRGGRGGEEGRELRDGSRGGKGSRDGGGEGGEGRGVSDRERSEWIECVRNEGYYPGI